jgi:hypothetical protein
MSSIEFDVYLFSTGLMYLTAPTVAKISLYNVYRLVYIISEELSGWDVEGGDSGIIP